MEPVGGSHRSRRKLVDRSLRSRGELGGVEVSKVERR